MSTPKSRKQEWDPSPGEGLTVARTVFLMRCNGASRELVDAYIAHERRLRRNSGGKKFMGDDAVWCDICGELVSFFVSSSVCSQECHDERRRRLNEARAEKLNQRYVEDITARVSVLKQALAGATPTPQRNVRRCPHPEKKWFSDPVAANDYKHGAPVLSADDGLRPYLCACGAWHLGHDRPTPVLN